MRWPWRWPWSRPRREPPIPVLDAHANLGYRIRCSGCGLDQDVRRQDYIEGRVTCRGCGRGFLPRNGFAA